VAVVDFHTLEAFGFGIGGFFEVGKEAKIDD